MLAEIQQVNDETVAEFHRDFPYPIQEVWTMLTDNDHLVEWFSELRIHELAEGGKLLFDIGDGSYEEMTITEVKIPTVWEFTWDKNLIRFNLSENPRGTHLVLKEYMKEVTEHTARDIAGWHVCLDVIGLLLANKPIEDRQEEWNKVYPQYNEQLTK